MSEEKRTRVKEWRITTRVGAFLTARWWIESDPEHGGIPADEAGAMAEMMSREDFSGRSAEDVASLLLEAMPAANSVEVCTEQGYGVAMHRDWP